MNFPYLKEDYKEQIAGNILSGFAAYDISMFKDAVITAKGYANYFGVSIGTAKRYLTRDRKHLALPPAVKLRTSHFVRLYGTPFAA